MPYHLKDDIIDGHDKASVDKVILNSALDLGFSYYLSKKHICSLKVGDVFDGNEVVNRIARGDKSPIVASPELKAFLVQYIKYLREHYSVASEEPLFPEYYGVSGEKNLRRHIGRYSEYRDFHVLIHESYKSLDQALLAQSLGFEERISAIARITRKSARTIRYSLFERFHARQTRRRRTPQEPLSDDELPDEVNEEA